MSEYFIYYASINIVGAVIFGIMLANDYIGLDRQEKQLKYDHALIAFILYFLSDAIWAGLMRAFSMPIYQFWGYAMGPRLWRTCLEERLRLRMFGNMEKLRRNLTQKALCF